MDDEVISSYISGLMQKEVAPSIPYKLDSATARSFGAKVLDRFQNPYLKHHWISITMQYSSKMKLRCVPLLLKHYQLNKDVPELFALGFAAYLYFMKATIQKDGNFYGELNGNPYLVQDDQAELFYKRWAGLSTVTLVKEVLLDQSYWGEDLHALPGFRQAVTDKLNLLINSGVKEAIESIPSQKVVAA
jgi:tagaturonate reductase